jgi:hypothetical protein
MSMTDEDIPSITERTTGSGGVKPHALARAGEGAGEVLAQGQDKRGSGGDEQTVAEGPIIHGIEGAPPATSVTGNERGLTRPPHDPEDV